MSEIPRRCVEWLFHFVHTTTAASWSGVELGVLLILHVYINSFLVRSICKGKLCWLWVHNHVHLNRASHTSHSEQTTIQSRKKNIQFFCESFN